MKSNFKYLKKYQHNRFKNGNSNYNNMGYQKFINRNLPLKFINDAIQHSIQFNKGSLLLIYGRRRVGKTELGLQISKEFPNAIYYLAIKGTKHTNLLSFHKTCGESFTEILDIKLEYEAIFRQLKDKTNLIILDEYQYLIEKDFEFDSLLQKLIDREFLKTPISIILIGSSISGMKKLEEHTRPLLGRFSEKIEIQPLEFWYIKNFFPSDVSMKELIEIYGFTDGLPAYLIKVRYPFWDWLEKEIMKRDFFKREVSDILGMEFTKPATYFDILVAIGSGCTRFSKIANEAGISETSLSPYMQNLLFIELIERRFPITDIRSPKSHHSKRSGKKRTRYYLKDNFLKFWFRFIYPNYSLLEQRQLKINRIKEGYNNYLSEIFESICRNFILKSKSYDFVGVWWGKIKGTSEEIDILGFNENNLNALIGECKWKDNISPKSILNQKIGLEDGLNEFYFNKKPRTYEYRIFARSFTKKISSYKGRQVECYDLDDLQN
ncbi:MAG: ATP-binding protein, partial [Promethearchaeota archaeon]